MKLIITIDTEGDNQWDPALPRSTDNIRFVPRFQDLCDRYDFPPTCLCTHEVAGSPAFDEILLPLHRNKQAEIGAPHRDLSVFAGAYKRDVPATMHVAVGTDVAHMHPSYDGAALGLATFRDFQVLSEVVKGLDDGGVYLNVGSAVLLPEVFLKAINIARNIDSKPRRM